MTFLIEDKSALLKEYYHTTLDEVLNVFCDPRFSDLRNGVILGKEGEISFVRVTREQANRQLGLMNDHTAEAIHAALRY